jgi:Na+-transporting NADH:ubiquinone oxidoreductase subunit NqrB
MAARTVTAKRFPLSPGDTRALAAASPKRRSTLDPRDYQVAALATLLVLGKLALDFDVTWLQVGITLASVLAWQWLATRAAAVRTTDLWPARPIGPAGDPPVISSSRSSVEWKSALISGLSLCLLLRTRVLVWAAIAGVLAVGSKFVLRVPRAGGGGGTKHLLNPTNGAIVLLLICGAPVWVSPAQWGHHLPLAFGVAGFGSLVVHRSARSDVTLAFLAAWAALLFGRAAWLGQPWVAPLHQLENGSLALFAFHMISDPKTTPDSRAGRVVFACAVALGTGLVQFVLFRTNGLLWSLAACSLFVPLLDRGLPGRGFEWSAPGTGAQRKENHHAQSGARIPAGAAGGVRTA